MDLGDITKRFTFQTLTLGAVILLLLDRTGLGAQLPIVGNYFSPVYIPGNVSRWLGSAREIAPVHWPAVLAIIWQESAGVHYKQDGSVLIGGKGEIGMCQILPSTGAGLGFSVEDLRDPLKNITACKLYLDEAEGAIDDPVSYSEMFRYYNGGPLSLTNPGLSSVYSSQVVKKLKLILDTYLPNTDVIV